MANQNEYELHAMHTAKRLLIWLGEAYPSLWLESFSHSLYPITRRKLRDATTVLELHLHASNPTEADTVSDLLLVLGSILPSSDPTLRLLP